MDFSLDPCELTRLASLTHGCGQKEESLYYLIASDVQGDMMCMRQMGKFFADRGAVVLVRYCQS